MRAPPYPAALERWWLDRARDATGADTDEEAIDRLEDAARRLSDSFTVERPDSFVDYGADTRLRAAYGLYFFPRSYTRIRLILRESMAAGWSPGAGPVRALDLGAGTGAASFAVADELAPRPAAITLIDASPASLAAACDLFRDCGSTLIETRAGSLHDPAPGSDWDIIVCSFAANEVDRGGDAFERLRAWLRALRPGGLLLLCEPAQESSARRMEELRDRVSATGAARILAPCLHTAPCPLHREGKVWCHEVRRWAPPTSLQRLNRRLQRDVHVIKWSFLALENGTPCEVEPSPLVARLVASVQSESGKLTTRGCATDGAIHAYEVLTRRLDRATRERTLEIERGACVRWPDATPAGTHLRASAPPTTLRVELAPRDT